MFKRVLVGALMAATLLLNGGVAMAQGMSEDDPAFVPIRNNQFAKPEIVVPAGTTVTWFNFDEVSHDVIERTALLFESPIIAPGESFSLTFDMPGVYAYWCDLHANQEGVVIVV